METPKATSGDVTIDASGFDTQRVLFFDRFSIHRGERFVEFHFGFYGQARELQRGLVAVLSRQSIDEQKDIFMQYLQRLGMPEPGELLPCNLRGEAEVVTADIIGMAQHGQALAEISLHLFSWKVVVDKVRKADSDKPLPALCVALLRCDVELQRRLILDLYEDHKPKGKTS